MTGRAPGIERRAAVAAAIGVLALLLAAPAGAQQGGAPTKLFPPESAAKPATEPAPARRRTADGTPLPDSKPGPEDSDGDDTPAAATPSDRLTLYPLAAESGAGRLQLATESARRNASFSVPRPRRVSAATLVTRFRNAADVLPARSRLELRVNGETVARLRLAAVTGQAEVAVDIPPSLLRADGNRLTVAVRQAHRVACTLDGTYDLWTELDAAATRLELVYDEAVPAMSAGNMNLWLRSAAFAGRPVRFLMPGPLDSAPALTRAAYAAQGLGARNPVFQRTIRVRPLPGAESFGGRRAVPEARFGGLDIPAMDRGLYVLLGTRDQLAPLLGRELARRIGGAHVGLHRLGGDPGKAALVISGPGEREVLRAARGFAGLGGALGADRLAPVPAATRDDKPLEPGRTYSFGELGFPGGGFNGLRYTRDLTFQLPDDLFPRHQQEAAITLGYAYGADLGPGAEMVMRINEKTVAAFDLDDPDGKRVTEHRIRLPLTRFRPGRNTLSFEAKLPRGEDAPCPNVLAGGASGGDGGGPRFALQADSSLRFSDFSRLYGMPNLRLLNSSGYPYTAPRDKPVDLYVASPEPGPVGAALTLVSRIRARSGGGFEVEAGYRFPELSSRDVLMVGSVPRLDTAAFENAPLDRARLRDILVPPRAVDDAAPSAGAAPERSSVDEASVNDRGLLARGLDALTRTSARARESARRVRLPFAPSGAILQYQSPQAPGKTWTVASAASPPALGTISTGLAAPALWHALDGQMLFFDARAENTGAVAAEDPYYITSGDLDAATLMLVAGNWFSEGIVLLIALVLVTCLLFGSLTFNLLGHVGRDTDAL